MLRPFAFLLIALSALHAHADTRVVASIYPLAMIATAVAKADTQVKLLIPTSASTHDYQLSGSDLKSLAEADVIMWAGPESEPYLAATLAQPRANQRVITLSKLPGVVWRDARLDSSPAAQAAAPGTGKFGRDPHLWLSTRNAALLARALAAHIGNPLAAEYFDAEMQRYRSRQAKRFAPVADMPLLVAHDAYGYLFDEIGLSRVSAVVIDPQVPPAPRRVAELADRVLQERIGCMIGEAGFEQQIGPRLFPDGHGNLVVIDPQLSGVSLTRSSYTLALTHLADTLYGCLVTR